MKYFTIFAYILSALILIILDISFFVNFEAYNATLLSSLIVLLILAILDPTRQFFVYALACVLLFSIFSSLPVPFIIFGFFVLPALINIIRIKFFPEPTPFTSGIYFLSGTFLFHLPLIFYGSDYSLSSLTTLIYFALLNTVVAIFCFSLYLIMRKRFSIGEIKL